LAEIKLLSRPKYCDRSGFFTRDTHDRYAFGLSVIGVVVAILWVRINLGSKFWQSRWESRLHVVEEELWPGQDLFSAEWDVVHADVKASLTSSSWWLGRLYNWRLLPAS
jgi:hypothetical protein